MLGGLHVTIGQWAGFGKVADPRWQWSAGFGLLFALLILGTLNASPIQEEAGLGLCQRLYTKVQGTRGKV